MSELIDRQLYQQLGELTAEVRALRTEIATSDRHTTERLSSLVSRVEVVETDVGAIKSTLDQVRGAAVSARIMWAVLGAGGGGAFATVVAQIAR